MACKRFFKGIFCCIVPCATNNRDDDVEDDFDDVNRELENLPNRDDQPALVEPEKVDSTTGYLTVTDEEEITTETTTNQEYENQEESVEISEYMGDGVDEAEANGQELDEESLDSDLSVCPAIPSTDDLNIAEETYTDDPINEDSEDSALLDTFCSDGTDLDFELEELEEDLAEIKFEGEIPPSSSFESEPSCQPSCSNDEQMSNSSPKCQDTLSDGEKSEYAGNCDKEELHELPDFIEKGEKNRKTVRFDYMVKCKVGNSVLRLPLCLPSKVFCTDDEESDEEEAETTDDYPITSQLASKASQSQDSPGPSSASRLRSRLGQLSLQYFDSSEVTADSSNGKQSPVSTSSQSAIAGPSSTPENCLGESPCPRVSVSSRFRSSMAELSAEYSTSEESLNSEDSVINSSPDVNSTTSSDSGTETPTIDASLYSCPSPATSSTSNADSGYDENSPPDGSRNRLRGRLKQLGERFANYE